jgi:hypothetical protein
MLKLNIFSDLIAKHASWDALKGHLLDNHFKVVEDPSTAPNVLIRYVKGTTVGDEVPSFRSVIWNTETNRPVCVAPTQALEGPPSTGKKLVVSELIDGFMVNVFCAGGNLTVATRSLIGGANTYYKGAPSFGTLFDEALAATPLKGRAGLADALGEGGFASFVVQHSSHRIIAPVRKTALYCVHVGEVDAAGGVTLNTEPVDGPLGALAIKPFEVTYAEKGDIYSAISKRSKVRGQFWQGYSYRDLESGARWRIRSNSYLAIKELRGKDHDSLDRFLRLRSEKKVAAYLAYFREDREAFWKHEGALREATKRAYATYGDCHKAHSVAFKDLDAAMKPVVYKLHLKWLEQLREKGEKLRFEHCVEVVNAMKDYEQRRLVEFVSGAVEAAAGQVADLEAQEPAGQVADIESQEPAGQVADLEAA